MYTVRKYFFSYFYDKPTIRRPLCLTVRGYDNLKNKITVIQYLANLLIETRVAKSEQVSIYFFILHKYQLDK